MVCYKMLKVLFPAICFYYVATGRTPQIGRHVRVVKTGQEIATGAKKTSVLQRRQIKSIFRILIRILTCYGYDYETLAWLSSISFFGNF